MKTEMHSKQTYDHRLKEFVRETGDISIALELGVPRSTATSWLTTSLRPVVTHEFFDLTDIHVRARIQQLEQQVKILTGIMLLLLTAFRLSRRRLNWERLPDGDSKRMLLRAVERARNSLSLSAALSIIGLSSTRYHSWQRARINDCQLDDLSSCPKTYPAQLLPEDLQAMHEMATSADYRHIPTSTLAILAQRLGKVFASPATWCRYVRERGWRRPRKRVHPAKPTEGIRADRPDGMWHIDVTVLPLLDGTKAYLQAIIDNFSRRILAWRLDAKLEPTATAVLLVKAFNSSSESADEPQSLMVDGGIENTNHAVGQLCGQGLLRVILAQTDLHFSNSMIEAFWRALKHQWLFLNSLDNIATLRKLVEFYVNEYNSSLPHSAFKGQTPDEMYLGTGENIVVELEASKAKAREERLTANRNTDCDDCKDTNIARTPISA